MSCRGNIAFLRASYVWSKARWACRIVSLISLKLRVNGAEFTCHIILFKKLIIILSSRYIWMIVLQILTLLCNICAHKTSILCAISSRWDSKFNSAWDGIESTTCNTNSSASSMDMAKTPCIWELVSLEIGPLFLVFTPNSSMYRLMLSMIMLKACRATCLQSQTLNIICSCGNIDQPGRASLRCNLAAKLVGGSQVLNRGGIDSGAHQAANA